MLKQLSTITVVLAVAFTLVATVAAQSTSNGRDPFVTVDRDLVPTGIIYDRVLPLSRIERYDGGADAAPGNASHWRQVYFELYRASLDTPAWPTTDALRADARRAGPIPIRILNMAYHRLRPAAESDGSIRVRDGELVVTEGAENPFREARVFAAAAARDETYRGRHVEFRLDGRDYFTNDARAVDRVEVDFDDGLGYRPLRFGQDVAASYASEGLKTVRLRLTLEDDTELHARFHFTVRTLQAPLPHDTLSLAASIPYNGEFGSGEAYVYLADGHASITQPLVAVEGFDLDNTLNWDEMYAILNEENLVEDLRAAGYDIVVLNFTNAVDYLQKNAFVLLELIEHIQSLVAPQVRFSLVGASMGGLVGRYTLAYMEANALSHRVATFMTFDTPHSGANIPLGIQYWLTFFASESEDAAFLLSRLDEPAARQMLVYHYTDPPSVTPSADPLYAAFEADLALIGDYPALPRNVAIANGSGNGADQGFTAGEQVLLYEYNSFLVDVIGNVWAVPDGGSLRIFQGLMDILLVSHRELDVTVNGTLPFDNAPGGSRASMAQMDSVTAPFGDIVALHDSHCFIPTISALDVDTSDPFYDIAGDPSLLMNTPFDAVYFPAANQAHVNVTAENAAWILGEILSSPTAIPPTVAQRIGLEQNTPNPFNPSTTIRFSIEGPQHVRLAVYDVRGRRVATLVDRVMPAGPNEIRWDGRDDDGRASASGVYFYRLVTDAGVRARKMVLTK